MAVEVPEEFGGTGLDYLAYAIATEEISRFVWIVFLKITIILLTKCSAI